MSGLVFLRHPDLPDGQWVEVPEESRFHYSAAGWQLVPAEDVADRAAREARAVAVVEAAMAGLPAPPVPDPGRVQPPESGGGAAPASEPAPESDSETAPASAASKRSK